MSLWVSSRAMGRPTDSLRPIIVAFFFSKGSLYDSTKQRVARAEEGRFTIYSSAEISKKRVHCSSESHCRVLFLERDVCNLPTWTTDLCWCCHIHQHPWWERLLVKLHLHSRWLAINSSKANIQGRGVLITIPWIVRSLFSWRILSSTSSVFVDASNLKSRRFTPQRSARFFFFSIKRSVSALYPKRITARLGVTPVSSLIWRKRKAVYRHTQPTRVPSLPTFHWSSIHRGCESNTYNESH